MKQKKGSVNSNTEQLELTQPEQQIEGILKSEDSLRDLRKNTKWTNICIIGVPEEVERGRKLT